MSVFTNAANRAAEEAGAYTDAILELLGDRDPMSVLRETPSALPRAIDGLSPQQLRQREAPGKWSIAHVLQHLADSDVVWAWRMRLILAQDWPPIIGYDQVLWADQLHYDKVNPSDARANVTTIYR